MFGYVNINKPKITFENFDKFQSYYCGLCQSLKEEHGIKSQLTLNNDLNFVSILLSGVYEPDEIVVQKRCVMHPIHKRTMRYNQYSKYASDMTIALTYYKCDDDVIDDSSVSKKIFQKVLKKEFLKIKEKYPYKIEVMEKELNLIHELEKKNTDDLDLISSCFGRIMGEIMVYQDDIFKDDLYQLGFYLGKFIYLIDAYEDIEEDIEKNHYNPLKEKFKQDNFQEYCFHILEMMMAQCSGYFEKLPIIENYEILKNILYSGIWYKFKVVKKKRMEGKS